MTTRLDKAIGRAVPFANELGIEPLEIGAGKASFALELEPRHMNSFKSAHGGVVMTLLDLAMAIAARSLDPEAVGAVTVEMKASFIGVARGRIVAQGCCVHQGTTVSFCEAEAKDPSGRTIARASGTFMVRKERGPK